MYWREEKAWVDWIFLDKNRFLEPFHNDTINLLLREPFNALFRHQTPIDFLGEIDEKQRGVAPKGFIFHVSRCGSTLVSQMLASLPQNIVISEASIFDKIIRAENYFPNVSEEQKIQWLRWTVNALAQKRFAAEENLFIKFDSWGILDLPLIEKAFPDVPWIFMYRNPTEVIVSNLRQPGAQMIPGAIQKIFPTMNLMDILQLSTEERFARTIAAFCQAALDNIENKNAMLVNYTQLPEVATTEICQHFQVAFTDGDVEKMKKSSKFNAKIPNEKFQPDTTEKRREASETVIHFAEHLINPLYEKLEKARLQKSIKVLSLESIV